MSFLGVAPARERGLKLTTDYHGILLAVVAPARERGLKCNTAQMYVLRNRSLPRGSVD